MFLFFFFGIKEVNTWHKIIINYKSTPCSHISGATHCSDGLLYNFAVTRYREILKLPVPESRNGTGDAQPQQPLHMEIQNE